MAWRKGTRLWIPLTAKEMRAIAEAAERVGLTVPTWVRLTLERAAKEGWGKFYGEGKR